MLRPMGRTKVLTSMLRVRGALWTGALALLALSVASGCDEAKEPSAAPKVSVEEPEEVEPPQPVTKTAERLSVDEIGPLIGYSRVVLTDSDDKPVRGAEERLTTELSAQKEFIAGKEITLEVSRKAKPGWVASYLRALAPLGASKISIATESRTEFPKSIPFVPEDDAKSSAPPCSLAGIITEDRGTAIWRLSGGTARKRGRGMGGPDLTMTGDTIVSMAKGCDSDYFVVGAAPGIEWGLIYDLAASAMVLEKAHVTRAVLPTEALVAGTKIKLGSL